MKNNFSHNEKLKVLAALDLRREACLENEEHSLARQWERIYQKMEEELGFPHSSDLNDSEELILQASVKSSEGNDHDFGFTDEVRPKGFSVNQVKGYLSSLERKGYMTIYQERVNGERVNQFVFTDKAFQFLGLKERA